MPRSWNVAAGDGNLHDMRGGAAGGRGCSRPAGGGGRTVGWRQLLLGCRRTAASVWGGGEIAAPAAGCYLRVWVEDGCRAGSASGTAGG